MEHDIIGVLTIGDRRFAPALKFERPKFKFVAVPIGQETCSRTGKPLYALPGGGRATEAELRRLYGSSKSDGKNRNSKKR